MTFLFRALIVPLQACILFLAIHGVHGVHGNDNGEDGSNIGIADHVDLPSPLPLDANPFADDNGILPVDLAYETVDLAGRFIYSINDASQAVDVLPNKYTVHSFQDTGSTEVMIVSTESSSSSLESEQQDGKGRIMVVFRGTDETADGDWLTNIDLPKVPSFGPPNRTLSASLVVPALDYFSGELKNSTISLKVHRGFNNGVFSDGLYDHVVSILNSNSLLGRDNGTYYDHTVHFMGHSLGGANAQLMGTYYAHFHPTISVHITSLGAPRQGNLAYKILAESIPNLSIWRMVYCNDIVPRVPNIRYHHAGHLLYYQCDDNDENDVGANAYYRQSGDPIQGYAGVSLWDWTVSPLAGLDLVNHHLGNQYMEWLELALHDTSFWTDAFELEEEENRRSMMATTMTTTRDMDSMTTTTTRDMDSTTTTTRDMDSITTTTTTTTTSYGTDGFEPEEKNQRSMMTATTTTRDMDSTTTTIATARITRSSSSSMGGREPSHDTTTTTIMDIKTALETLQSQDSLYSLRGSQSSVDS
eukprot:scaffold1934_cov79-Cylindrotheca_fusiformis.AAC.12